MKKLFIISLFVLCIPASTMAADKWTTQNIIMEGTYHIIRAVDWSQTRYIANNPKRFHEMNPVIGRHPTTSKVNQYFLVTAFLHLAISHYLPENYRTAWQGMTIFVSAGLVKHNYSVGIKLNF